MDGRAQVLINKKKNFTNQQIDSYEEETRGARRDAGVAQTIQWLVQAQACMLMQM